MADDVQCDVVCTKTAQSALEFLNLLSPYGPIFRDADVYEWMFRGHALDSNELLPTALRLGNRDRVIRSSLGDLSNEPDIGFVQAAAEINLLSEFLHTTNDAGLPVPGIPPGDPFTFGIDATRVREIVPELLVESIDINSLERIVASRLGGTAIRPQWPPYALLEVMSIARHNGLLTRVLDWTSSPTTAAYFAAAGAVRQIEKNPALNPNECLCVWVLHKFVARMYPVSGHSMLEPDIHFVPVQYSGNPNMFAQSGVLTIVPAVLDGYPRPTDRTPLDKFISERSDVYSQRVQVAAKAWGKAAPKTLMYRIQLPLSLAPELLWQLFRDRVTHYRMFPNFEGVVRTMDEKQFLMNYGRTRAAERSAP